MGAAAVLSRINCVLFLLQLLVCSYDSRVQGDDQGFHVLRLESLLPANVCTTSKGPSDNSLKVVHRHGPCFPFSSGQPDHLQILSRDSLRAAYLQNGFQLANAPGNTSTGNLGQASITLRAFDGNVIGSDRYVVTIGIGTPKRDQTVIFDTASNVCWIQCKPCPSCYQQLEPMFDPSASSSYHNVPFTAPPCANLPPESRNNSGNNCMYRVQYSGSSGSSGFLATERLTLASVAVVPSFVFGCGQRNFGFRGAGGIFGLGRNYHSLVSQAPNSLGKVFSYCLPVSSSVSGHLTIGSRTVPSPLYARMPRSRAINSGQYTIDLIGITVGTQRLHAPPSMFQNVGTLMDSGTLVTRLPRMVYVELRETFRSSMTQYRLVAPIHLLDTCYDFSNVRNGPLFPPITLHFTGHTSRSIDLVLKPAQVFYVVSNSQVCLAFAPTDRFNDPNIIGAIQQRGSDVIYDLDLGRIGFAAGNCG